MTTSSCAVFETFYLLVKLLRCANEITRASGTIMGMTSVV